MSLHSFFGAKASTTNVAATVAAAAATVATGASPSSSIDLASDEVAPSRSQSLSTAAPAVPSTIAANAFTAASSLSFAQPPAPAIAAAAAAPAAWAALLDQKSTDVKCPTHSMTCKLLTVNKAGANHGRKFYLCPLPPPAQCDFFLWANGKKGSAGANTKDRSN